MTLRIVNGTVDDLRDRRNLQATWNVPQRELRTCTSCKQAKPMNKFIQRTRSEFSSVLSELNGKATRRCSACVHQARRSPGGLLGYRNPR